MDNVLWLKVLTHAPWTNWHKLVSTGERTALDWGSGSHPVVVTTMKNIEII